MLDEDSSCPIVDFRDEPVRVAFDIEHRELFHRICRRQFPPHFHKIFPDGLFRNPIPNIQGRADVGMRLGRLQQPLAADDVHFRPLPLNSQIANLSSGSYNAHVRPKIRQQPTIR